MLNDLNGLEKMDPMRYYYHSWAENPSSVGLPLISAFVIGMSVLVLMSAILISANEVVHVHVWLANTGAILTRREGYTLTGGGGRWG